MRQLYATCLLLLYPLFATAEDVLTAKFPRSLSHVHARLCFDGPAPTHLFRHKDAGTYSNGIFLDGKRLEISGYGSSVRLPALPDDACIDWHINFKAALKKKNYRLILQRDKDLVMSANLWFWKASRSRDLVVDIKLPGGMSISTPWMALDEGFKRGENGTHGGSLAQATRNGWRSTMRVYWSGAALMLMADMQLRESSGGLQSLDTALQALSACCMENGKTWRAREMFSRLDKLTGTDIFTGLYREYVHEEGFPDMRSTWENLGINTRHDHVSLSKDAPLAGVRNAIMKG